MKLRVLLFGLVILSTCHTTSMQAINTLPTKQTIGQLLNSVCHRIKIVPRVASAFVRHKYLGITAIAVAGLWAIPKTRHVILSGIQTHKPLLSSVYKRTKRFTRTSGIILLTSWYWLTTLFGLIIDCRDSQHKTLLYEAIKNNKTMTVISLINAGADPNLVDLNALASPLHCAACRRNIDIIKALLGAGADPNIKITHCSTPLYRATANGFTEIVRALLGAGADPNTPIKHYDLPLFEAIRKGYTEIVRALIDAHANPNVQNSGGETPLHRTSRLGHPEIVQMLLAAGADPNAYSYCGRSPLYETVLYNEQDQDYALHKQLETVYVLIQAGAREFIHPGNGYRFNLETNKSASKVFHKCLQMAIERNDIAVVNSLLTLGDSATKPDAQGSTAMHNVIGAYNPDEPTPLDAIARAIVHSVGPQATQVRDAQGRTPLHIAALRGNRRLANLLLHNGADVNAQDNDGNTPMHLIQDSQRMPNLLLTYGADWSIENHAGENPVYSNNCWIAWLNRKAAQ